LGNLSEKIKKLNVKPIILVDQVSKALSDLIIEGSLKGGEQLVEATLQKQFSISKSPIREAFRVLEKNGFVEIIPRKGTFVKKISEKNVKENFPIRAYLEGFAAALAASRLSFKDIGKMKKALSSMEKATQKQDHKRYLKHHIEFHDIFIKVCGNDSLIDILERLRREAFWFRSSYFLFRTDIENILDLHHEILKYFIEKDGSKAEHLVKMHILDALDEFVNHIRSL